MKDIYILTDQELTDLAFRPSDKNTSNSIDYRKRNLISKTDKTYLLYPSVEVSSGKIAGYPFEGWTTKEIENFLKKTAV